MRVEWSQSLGRWVAVFEDTKMGLSVEFPLSDTYSEPNAHNIQRNGGMSPLEERTLALVFLRLAQNKLEMLEAQLQTPSESAVSRALTTPPPGA